MRRNNYKLLISEAVVTFDISVKLQIKLLLDSNIWEVKTPHRTLTLCILGPFWAFFCGSSVAMVKIQLLYFIYLFIFFYLFYEPAHYFMTSILSPLQKKKLPKIWPKHMRCHWKRWKEKKNNWSFGKAWFLVKCAQLSSLSQQLLDFFYPFVTASCQTSRGAAAQN